MADANSWETFNGRYYLNGDYSKDFGLGQIDPSLGHAIGTNGNDPTAGGRIKVLSAAPTTGSTNVGAAGSMPGSAGSGNGFTSPAPTTPPVMNYGSPTPTVTPNINQPTQTQSYGAGYYKDPTSGTFFQKGSDGTVSIVSSGATYNQLKSGSLASTAAPYTTVASSGRPVAPSAVSTIGSTITAPSGSSTTPPKTTGTALTVADDFNTSLATTIANQQKQLQDELGAKTADYKSQIDALTQQSDTYKQLQESGIATMGDITLSEAKDKADALQQERAQFQQNFDARQKLTDQLTTLLTSGQQVIEGMKATTGLSSIMSPRIAQTMTDVQAQAGVITAALSAYSDQIGLAQSQLKSASDAISSIYTDQLDYWKNVVNFYNDQQKTTDGKITKLSADEKTYVDAQIQILQDKVANTQKTADAIQQAMLDPRTAMDYAKAGVTLADSPEQISQKLATYEAAQQKVWGAPHFIGGDYIQTNSLTGETRTVVANATTGGSGISVSNPQYAGVVSTILGSGKFTKDQSAQIANAINSGDNPLAVVRNQAKNIMGQTEATSLTKYEAASQSMNDLQSALAEYYAAGGKTGILSGNYEKVINNLGSVNDPALVDIATQIASQLQVYRNAVSGTAYSVQEGKEIGSVFPGINKSEGLNQAIISGRLKSFDSSINSTYAATLGSNVYNSVVTAAGGKADASSKDYVEATLSKAGVSYDKVLAAVPAGQIAVIDNQTGQVGHILPGEYNSTRYTRL